MKYTPSAAGRRIIIADAPGTSEPAPPILNRSCPACKEPLARPGVVAKYHKWYHEECLPAKSAQSKGRTRLPPGTTKINYMTRLPPDLVEWLRSLDKGETERILQAARTNSLIRR